MTLGPENTGTRTNGRDYFFLHMILRLVPVSQREVDKDVRT
jgi:hypothetical protein